MSKQAVVIGGGHNGLVAALTLARGGYAVKLFEAGPRLGGVCSAWNFAGTTLPGMLHETRCLNRSVCESLDLTSHGLKWEAPPPILVAGRNGQLIELQGDEIGGDVSASDQESHNRWITFLKRVRPVLESRLTQAPPSLELTAGDVLGLGSAGLALRMLGQRDMLELVRVLPMAVSDWLSEHFEDQLLRAGLAFPSMFGSFVGPRAAGTSFNLLSYRSLAGQSVVGGGAALIAVLESRVGAAGVQIETQAAVRKIVIENGRVAGVQVGASQEPADVVVATCDPAQVFLELLDPFQLTVRQIGAVRSFRSRGLIAKIHLQVEGDLQLAGRNAHRFGRAYLGVDSLDDLERSMDAAKYGEFSRRPTLDVWTHPGQDGSGETLVSILAGAAPGPLKGGWQPEAREAFLECVIDQLEACVGPLRSRIRAAELLTPEDLAHHFRLPGGHLCHLEHALDQLFVMRPAPFAGRYSTPIAGLYLAGSGSHPGGGVTGLPGFLGAGTALRGG